MINDLWNKLSNNKVFKIFFWSLIFVGIPLIINVLLCCTDFLYKKMGWTLSPEGIQNKSWLEFWCNYLIGIIALVSVYSLWSSSKRDRNHQNNIELAKYYSEHICEEQRVIINMCKAFDTSVPYKMLNQGNMQNIVQSKQVIQMARDNVLNTQCELEIITDIVFWADDRNDEKPEDLQLFKLFRETYYTLEQKYINILDECDYYLSLIEEQRYAHDKIQITSDLIRAYKDRIQILQASASSNYFGNQYGEICKSQNAIDFYSKEIISLNEKIKSLDDEKASFGNSLDDFKEISQKLKPKLIGIATQYIRLKNSKLIMIIQNDNL